MIFCLKHTAELRVDGGTDEGGVFSADVSENAVDASKTDGRS